MAIFDVKNMVIDEAELQIAGTIVVIDDYGKKEQPFDYSSSSFDQFKNRIRLIVLNTLSGTWQFDTANDYKWHYRMKQVVKHVRATRSFKTFRLEHGTSLDEELATYQFLVSLPKDSNIFNMVLDIVVHGGVDPKGAHVRKWLAQTDDGVFVKRSTQYQILYGNRKTVKPSSYYRAFYLAVQDTRHENVQVVSVS